MLKGLNGSVGTILCDYYDTDRTALLPLVDLHDLFIIRVPNLGNMLHTDHWHWRSAAVELGRPIDEFLQESDEHIVNILILENVRFYLTG